MRGCNSARRGGDPRRCHRRLHPRAALRLTASTSPRPLSLAQTWPSCDTTNTSSLRACPPVRRYTLEPIKWLGISGAGPCSDLGRSTRPLRRVIEDPLVCAITDLERGPRSRPRGPLARRSLPTPSRIGHSIQPALPLPSRLFRLRRQRSVPGCQIPRGRSCLAPPLHRTQPSPYPERPVHVVARLLGQCCRQALVSAPGTSHRSAWPPSSRHLDWR